MKADTFSKLIILQTLIDAEIGHYLEHHPAAADAFREGMVARIADLIDQIDALDAVAAARVYDAVVDFLAEFPEGDDELVEATLRFKRAVNRVVERGMEARELAQPSTWATVLDELLETLAAEYTSAVNAGGDLRPREYLRASGLLARSRATADRLLWTVGGEGAEELNNGMDRLVFAVRNRRLPAAVVEELVRPPQRIARRHRPSTLTRVGTFVVGQLLRRAVTARETKTP